jgi:crossover junction endodeoxyribonuclease RuvC
MYPGTQQRFRPPLTDTSAPMSFASGNAFESPQRTRYLGIDPGLNRTGYCLLSRGVSTPTLEEGGVITSTAALSLAERVAEIGRGIVEVIEEFAPETIAVEKVFSHGQFPKTAILMAHARGAILFAAAMRQIPVVHYTPTQVKRLLTGSGRASKEQVQLAVSRELALAEILEPNDVADACAVALCHYYSARLPAETPAI